MSMANQILSFILMVIGILSTTALVESTYHVEREPSCDCVCKDSFMDGTYSYKTLCQVISRFEKELLTVKQEIERRTVFINDIAGLKEIMEDQENSIRILEEQVEKLSSTRVESEALPQPASLVMEEDLMLGDSAREIRTKEDKKLVENVSTLIAKVEEVENMTSKVQEELRSERRVRRHLEEDLNETRFSIRMLDDKLLNVTLPMDNRVTHVEEIVLSTLENINKTLFEDHLKKLYYKVDGVVYKNETEKLDERLDQVETGLMDANNNNNMSSKFVEELNNLSGILSIMNQTIIEKLVEEEYRLGSLENKTTKLDELEGLQDQMENVLNKTSKLDELERLQDQMIILLNVTDSMQTRAIDLWMDIQSVRNTTTHLENEFYEQSMLTNKNVASAQQEVSRKLQAMNDGLSSLRSEVLSDRAFLSNLQTDLQILSADVVASESKVKNLSEASDKMMKEIDSKIENLSGVWDNSLTILAGQIEKWKNSKGADDTNDSSKYITQNKNTDEWTGEDKNEEVDLDRMRGKGTHEQNSCDLPSVNDEHLLMTLEKDSQGTNTLIFGCKPLGQYALEEEQVSLRCQDGSWDRDPPKCSCLKNETEIISLGNELKSLENPCRNESGDIPDVTNCSYFFKCDHGRVLGRIPCQPGLHFNAGKKRCEWAAFAKCTPSLPMTAHKSSEQLADLIPTILIDPDNVDKPFGLMGTNASGYLIVYPNSNLKLHCLFPENQMGTATWEAEKFGTGSPYRITYRGLKHRSTVEFNAIESRHSGIYTCKTPYNKKHSIRIVVEAVKCPAFQVDVEREKALTYNAHPDGGERVLSTTAQFFCEGGSPISTMCLPNGNWSRSVPTIEECPPRRTEIWGCDVFVKQSADDPEVNYDNAKQEIRFSCLGSRRLVGPAVATCIDNNWTLSSFPKCL